MAFNLSNGQERMEKAIVVFQSELNQIRAGRANPKILDSVEVDYFGAMTPLNQLAAISVPEARILMISPYDANSLELIEQSIYAANIGLTPNNDGTVIRLSIPQLTEESRKELAKDVKAEAEKAKVAIRNIRRDLMDDVKKDAELAEDQKHDSETKVQTLTDQQIKEVDQIAANKEKEILEI